MQLLIHATTTDPAAFAETVTDDWEGQQGAGLSRLQTWHGAGDPNAVWMLFDVNDRDRAERYLDAPTSAMHATGAHVATLEAHFLETA